MAGGAGGRLSNHRTVIWAIVALTAAVAHAADQDTELLDAGPLLEAPQADDGARRPAPTPDASVAADTHVGDGGADAGVTDEGAIVDGGRPSDVRVGDTVVFTLKMPRGTRSAATRAATANTVLASALKSSAGEVRVEHGGDVSVIYVDGAPVVQLTRDDASVAGDASLSVHADRIGAVIRQAMKEERERSAVAGTIFNVSLAVLFAVLAFYLLRRAWELGDRADLWLSEHPERVPTLRLRSIEVVAPGTLRGALTLALGFGRWLVLGGIVYAWLIATFSLFAATRGLTERLTGALVTPLTGLAARVAASVPLLVAVFFAVLTLGLVLRAVRVFFAEVARGATTVGWLPRDFAVATGSLTQGALVVFALVLVAPVITGNADGAPPRVGLLVLAACALAAVPLAASTAVGALTIFRRRFAVGDFIEVGAVQGRVVALRLFDVAVRDDAGVETVVPHLVRLWRPTRVHGPKRRVRATASVERALVTPALRAKLEQALAPVGADVEVRLVTLEPNHATLEVTLTSAATDAASKALWVVLAVVDEARQPR